MTKNLNVRRAEAKDLARRQAWFEEESCPHCEGTGKVVGGDGRKLVHCFTLGGVMLGADWDIDAVVAAIDEATAVSWVKRWDGHDLMVTLSDGRQRVFQVSRVAP